MVTRGSSPTQFLLTLPLSLLFLFALSLSATLKLSNHKPTITKPSSNVLSPFSLLTLTFISVTHLIQSGVWRRFRRSRQRPASRLVSTGCSSHQVEQIEINAGSAVGGNRPFAASTVPKMKQFAENVRECEAAQSTISSIWHEGIKGFLKELKIIENGIPSEWYWVPVLNYFWLQSMLLLLMMHLFYLLVFASFFLIMERKLPVRITPWTLFVLLWYSSKKNTSSVYTLHHCSGQAL